MRAYFLQIEIYSFILECWPAYWWGRGMQLYIKWEWKTKQVSTRQGGGNYGNAWTSGEKSDPVTCTDGYKLGADFVQVMCRPRLARILFALTPCDLNEK